MCLYSSIFWLGTKFSLTFPNLKEKPKMYIGNKWPLDYGVLYILIGTHITIIILCVCAFRYVQCNVVLFLELIRDKSSELFGILGVYLYSCVIVYSKFFFFVVLWFGTLNTIFFISLLSFVCTEFI